MPGGTRPPLPAFGIASRRGLTHTGRVHVRRLIAFVLLGVALAAPAASGPAALRTTPAAGIPLSAADRAALEQGSAAFGAELAQLRAKLAGNPRLEALLPDVEIFHKAVDWALRYDEFFRSNEVALARTLLAQGRQRAQRLADGDPFWLTATGLVVRGFRSRIDDSVQPYGLVVPATFAADTNRSRRLDVWLHGRDDKLTELKFLGDRLRSPGEFAPADTFVLHPYGRFCNAFKFAGETDVFEALAHASKSYPVDQRRLAMRGFSMGGAGAWHLGAHHPGRWAVVNPGAGFVDVLNYQKLAGKLDTVPWYQQKLWNLYDPLACAINLNNAPLVAYSGETDSQKAAADLMEAALRREGITMTHLIGPKTGHKYEPETKKSVARLVDEAANRGLDPQPRKVTLVTHSLKFNRAHWLTIDALEKHWEPARIEAEVVLRDDTNQLIVTSRNVAAFSVNFAPAGILGRGAVPVVDGQSLGFRNMVGSLPPPGSGLPASWWSYSAVKSGGRWQEHRGFPSVPTKTHGRQGPIDDAFMSRFMVVPPTGKANAGAVDTWLERELARFTNEWRAQFRGDVLIAGPDSRALERAAQAGTHLIVWGTPARNAVLADMLPQLPLQWDAKELRLGTRRFDATTHVPVLIFPNPLNPACYVVLNSGPTYFDLGAASNAQQTPKLPDFAVLDVTVPRAERLAAGVKFAGFFDEQWRLPEGPQP